MSLKSLVKPGDIVTRKYGGWNAARIQGHTGLVIRVFKKKRWNDQVLGHRFDWESISAEDHAEVVMCGLILTIPSCDLEIIKER